MNVECVRGHKEWTGRKSDPKYSMDWRREQVASFRPTSHVRVLGERVLRLGLAGSDVAELQRILKLLDDGQFGPKTDAAVRYVQHAHRLSVTGVVDAVTLAVIRKSIPASPETTVQEIDMFLVDDPNVGHPVDSPKQFLCDAHTRRWVKSQDELNALKALGIPHMTEKPETRVARQSLLNARLDVTAEPGV